MQLATKQEDLKVIEDKVAALQLQLMRARSKNENLSGDREGCEARARRAEILLSSLGQGSQEWSAKQQELEQNLKLVIGNSFMMAAFMAYAGPFPAEYRSEMVEAWLKTFQTLAIPTDQNWRCVDVLTDPNQVPQWQLQSLPLDKQSVENAILATRGELFPLMIDPQGQGNKWIKRCKEDASFEVLKLTTPNFLKTLEGCIRDGGSVLLENVDEALDPCLDPILVKQVFNKDGQAGDFIQLGASEVLYHRDFRLFITTLIANPHFQDDISSKVTVIDFTITSNGLEDRVLTEILRCERPELADQRDLLVKQLSADKFEVDRIDKAVLKMLGEAGEDLLADDKLIIALGQSKQSKYDTEERISNATTEMNSISEVADLHRPAAAKASIMFTTLAEMSALQPMYSCSPEFFVCLLRPNTFRAEELCEFLFKKICLGLFEDHKLLFAFLFA